MQDPFASDAILINRLHANTVVGSDSWGKKRPQPLVVSVRLSTSLQQPAETDDIQHTVNYGTLYKSIMSELGGPLNEMDTPCTLADIANNIVVRCITPLITQCKTSEPISTIRIEAPKTLLSGALWGYEIQTQGLNQNHYKYFVKDLRISVIIGVNPPERLSKQVVELDIEFYDHVQPDIIDSLVKYLETTSYFTLEAFAGSVIEQTFKLLDHVGAVTVTARKPNALPFADSSGVYMARTRPIHESEGSIDIRADGKSFR